MTAYYRHCKRCGSIKRVQNRQSAEAQYCRSCLRGLNHDGRGWHQAVDCTVCGLPLIGHPRCSRPQCGVLLGPGHIYQDAGGGIDSECAATQKERAGVLEDNIRGRAKTSGSLPLAYRHII